LLVLKRIVPAGLHVTLSIVLIEQMNVSRSLGNGGLLLLFLWSIEPELAGVDFVTLAGGDHLRWAAQGRAVLGGIVFQVVSPGDQLLGIRSQDDGLAEGMSALDFHATAGRIAGRGTGAFLELNLETIAKEVVEFSLLVFANDLHVFR